MYYVYRFIAWGSHNKAVVAGWLHWGWAVRFHERIEDWANNKALQK